MHRAASGGCRSLARFPAAAAEGNGSVELRTQGKETEKEKKLMKFDPG